MQESAFLLLQIKVRHLTMDFFSEKIKCVFKYLKCNGLVLEKIYPDPNSNFRLDLNPHKKKADPKTLLKETVQRDLRGVKSRINR
jgi:hypothetical protein